MGVLSFTTFLPGTSKASTLSVFLPGARVHVLPPGTQHYHFQHVSIIIKYFIILVIITNLCVVSTLWQAAWVNLDGDWPRGVHEDEVWGRLHPRSLYYQRNMHAKCYLGFGIYRRAKGKWILIENIFRQIKYNEHTQWSNSFEQMQLWHNKIWHKLYTSIINILWYVINKKHLRRLLTWAKSVL